MEKETVEIEHRKGGEKRKLKLESGSMTPEEIFEKIKEFTGKGDD